MDAVRCQICGYLAKNKLSLSQHIRLGHGIKPIDYYMKYIIRKKEIPQCKCGCGELVKFKNILEGFGDYKQGHYSRVHNNWGHNKKAIKNSAKVRKEKWKKGEITQWNKGLDKSDPRVAKYADKMLKENNPERGKKISETQKKRFKEGKLSNEGKNNPMFGKHHSDESKDKMKMSRVKYMNNYLANNESKLEKQFKKILNSLDIKYEFQYMVIKYNYDFYIPSKNILIEVDGDWWHCNPNKNVEPIYETQKHTLEHDELKNKWAKKNGYKLLRFWEDDIKNNRLEVIQKLINELKK